MNNLYENYSVNSVIKDSIKIDPIPTCARAAANNIVQLILTAKGREL